MNRKQTRVAWIGAVLFVFFAWNPRIIAHQTGYWNAGRWEVNPLTSMDKYKPLFDTSFTAMFGRLSSTAVVTSLAIYTLRDKKQTKGPE